MALILRVCFAVGATLLYVMVTGTVLWGAWRTEDFALNDAQDFLLEGTTGAVIAFLTAQLGLAAANDQKGVKASIQKSMGSSRYDEAGPGSEIILGLSALAFFVAGILFTWFWLQPGQLAPMLNEDGESTKYTAAPEFISDQSKLFVGVMLASLSALAPAASSNPQTGGPDGQV